MQSTALLTVDADARIEYCGTTMICRRACWSQRMKLLSLLFVVTFFTVGSVAAEQSNILLIVSEDNGPELGVYGDPYARTPVLDEFAARGVRFDRAYVAQAGCSPSRGAFLTGLYPHQNGQIGLATWRYRMYRDDTPNVVTMLKAAGYRSGILGKLHVNPESAFPFDFAAISSANFQRKQLGDYASKAAEFFGSGDEPFFLSVNYPDAHRPFLRQVDGLPKEPLDADDVRPMAYMGIESELMQGHAADYYNSIARLDSLIGDLLDELQASGKSEQTLVVYIGDHGADMFRGKRTSYEGGVRIPLLVQWPGHMKSGQVRAELVSTIDLLPTFLDAAALDPLDRLPGRSLAALIEGDRPRWRQYLFTEYHVHSNHNFYPQRAVRDDRYKLIRNLLPGEVNPGADFTATRYLELPDFERLLLSSTAVVRSAYERMRRPPEYELYDLETDPYEFRNLADEPGKQSELARLSSALARWRSETRDPFLEAGTLERLKAEVEATFVDGQYTRPDGWDYVNYLQH